MYSQQKKLSFDDLINFLDEWFKYDPEVIVKYNENSKGKDIEKNASTILSKNASQVIGIQQQNQQQNLKNIISSTIDSFQSMIDNTEDHSQKKILEETLLKIKENQQKFKDSKEKQRYLNLREIYDNYARQSVKLKNSDPFSQNYQISLSKYIQFFKDFGLYQIYLKKEVIQDVFQKFSKSSSHQLSFLEFDYSLNYIAQIIQPQQDLTCEQKLLKLYNYLKLDNPKDYKQIMGPGQSQKQNLQQSTLLFQQQNQQFQTPKLKRKIPNFQTKSKSKSPFKNDLQTKESQQSLNYSKISSSQQQKENSTSNNNFSSNISLKNSVNSLDKFQVKTFQLPMKNINLKRSLSPQAQNASNRATYLEQLENEKRSKTYQQVVYNIDSKYKYA